MKRWKTITALMTALVLLTALCAPAFAQDGYRAAFAVEGGSARITVYDTQDYTAGYEADTALARSSDTGEIDVSGDGQVNFTVAPAEGFAVADIAVEGSYKNLKGPADTGKENTWRVTKVASDLTITISLKAAEAEEPEEPGEQAESFTAAFAVTGGSAVITVYDTQDYTGGYEADTAIARNSVTGEIDASGDGQVNFTVAPAEGFAVADIAVEGSYKNLKGPADTGKENTWRVTKVASDLTVTIALKAAEAEEPEEPSGDTVVTFTDDAAAVAGNSDGVSVNGTAVSVTKSGVYTFTGSCADGRIEVKKNVTDVTLVLDGLTLSAHATAPIVCGKGSAVTIEAAEGSVNALEDDKYNNDDIYTDTKTYPDIENAVIKCKDGSTVTIGGTGTISVIAHGKNAVKGGADLYENSELVSKASLTVRDVTLNIESAYDGLKSDKELNILSGTVTVSAGDDGIKSEYTLNIGEQGSGGPAIDVTRSAEGIEAATINVYGGRVSVTAKDDGINAANGDLENYTFSYNQSGGYVRVNVTQGDGIDANGAINLTGGTLEVYAPSQGDGDPLDADAGITFGGATVLAVGHAAMQQRYTGTYVAFGGASGGRGGFGGRDGAQTTVVKAGDTIAITDANGKTVYTAGSKAARDASYVVFASPDLVSGGSYKLGSLTAAATGGDPGQQPPGGDPGQQPPGGDPGQQPPGDRPEPVRGDADLDGKVLAKDARLVLRASAKLETLEGPAFMNCDLDRDGKLTAREARLILRYSAKLETTI